MKNLKALYVILILVFFGFLIISGPDFSDLRFKTKEKLSQIENGENEGISSSINKQVYAPPPLKSDTASELGVLTKSGTIKETNIQREKDNLPKLIENDKLGESAMAKAKDILKNQYFDHISPSGTGPADIADEAGYDYIIIGENLALGGFKDDKALVNAWMNSPGHRENILNSGFREIGVATIQGKYEGKTVWVAVQEFGTAASYCPTIDSDLKNILDDNQKKISSLKKEIGAQKEGLNSLKKSDRTIYQNAVETYNDLVDQYNNLVGQTKAGAKKINKQIEEYNSCIKRYTKS